MTDFVFMCRFFSYKIELIKRWKEGDLAKLKYTPSNVAIGEIASWSYGRKNAKRKNNIDRVPENEVCV